jgi:hypothetical protein
MEGHLHLEFSMYCGADRADGIPARGPLLDGACVGDMAAQFIPWKRDITTPEGFAFPE